MRTSVVKVVTISILSVILILAASSWGAEKYPDHAVRIIVTWPPGSSQDVPQRIAAEYAEKILGVPIVVNNIAGASGMTGTREFVKTAKPDGYTFMSTADSTWYPIFCGLTDYSIDEFVYVANLLKQTLVLAVLEDSPWKTLKDLITDAKQHPEKVRFAMSMGNQSHFIPLNIQKMTGAKFKFVSIPGGDVKRQAAMLAGNVDTLLTYMTGIEQYVKAKKARVLAITFPERLPTHPDYPTFKEQGVDIVYEFRVGLAARKGTPMDRVKTFSEAYGKVSQNPEYIKKITNLGLSVDYMDHETLTHWMEKFTVSLKDYAQEAGYKVKK
jgi:tripartite-type tricarboxylate transporter receptor subunit TctC